MKPVNNSVFIEPIIDQQIGRIILPEQAKARHLPDKGIVRAIADDAKVNGQPVEFKVGDTVHFIKFNQNYDNGLPIIDGRKLTIVKAEDVVAVIGNE